MTSLSHAVGNKIRDLRIRRGFSLSELARESKVAKATLSNIEAGEANPTLDTLLNLSIALKAPVSSFFGEPQPDVKVVRASEMKNVGGDGLRGKLVAMYDIEASRIELFTWSLIAGAPQRSPAHLRGVVEHIIVHRGRVKVGPEGKEAILETGDYMRMDADQPHSYEGLTDDVYVTIVMQYPRDAESPLTLQQI